MDAFSKRHPAVNFIFFLGTIALTVLIQHPAYLLAGAATGIAYYLLLCGKKGVWTLLRLLPLFLILAAVNPLINILGKTPLFYVFGRPYTWEALQYGLVVGAMFVITVIWFGCYGKVLTGDKFTSLFGNLIPSISLLLVMVFRMIPNFTRKTRQIRDARKSIGKGTDGKIRDGLTVLGALTGWALEGSVVTGDSMRARGYGTARRTNFMIYRMTAGDWATLCVMTVLLGLTVTAVVLGQTDATFVPRLQLASTSWGVAAYTGYLMIPTVLHIKETVQWHISRSKI